MGIRHSNSQDASPSVEIHIEELVLHGFAGNDRLRIGAAIERELSRLIAQPGAHISGMAPINVDRMDAGGFQLAASATPQVIGRRVAQKVYRQLSSIETRPSQMQSREARPKP